MYSDYFRDAITLWVVQQPSYLQIGFFILVSWHLHYGDVIMGAIASQITSLTIVYSTVYSDADQRKHQSSASLAFVWGILVGTGEFPAQMDSNAENVSIWWRHHVYIESGPWMLPCLSIFDLLAVLFDEIPTPTANPAAFWSVWGE